MTQDYSAIDGHFQIKKGQGLSQAICEELGLNPEQTKQLSFSIWQEVFKCIEDENNEHESNDKIYTGGSELSKTCNGSFKVHAGQIIKLGAETFNKILGIVNQALSTDIKMSEQPSVTPTNSGGEPSAATGGSDKSVNPNSTQDENEQTPDYAYQKGDSVTGTSSGRTFIVNHNLTEETDLQEVPFMTRHDEFITDEFGYKTKYTYDDRDNRLIFINYGSSNAQGCQYKTRKDRAEGNIVKGNFIDNLNAKEKEIVERTNGALVDLAYQDVKRDVIFNEVVNHSGWKVAVYTRKGKTLKVFFDTKNKNEIKQVTVIDKKGETVSYNPSCMYVEGKKCDGFTNWNGILSIVNDAFGKGINNYNDNYASMSITTNSDGKRIPNFVRKKSDEEQ